VQTSIEALAASEIDSERRAGQEPHAADRALNLWKSDPADRFSASELHEAPAPMQHVVSPYLPAGCAAILTGAGGTNKTGLMTVIAIHVCIGSDLFGSSVAPGSVLYVSAEDRRDALRRHVFANSRNYADLDRKRISQRLYVKDTVGFGFKLTRHIDGQTDVAGDIWQLIDYCGEIPDLRLVCLDTLSRLNGGEENNEDLARFVEAMERIGRETGAAVIATHHSGKAQMRADTNDQYAGRGGSALSDNARSVMHLSRLTVESANTPMNGGALIAEGRLLRLSHVKSNYARAAEDVYLERVATPHAAELREFLPEFSKADAGATWETLRSWLATQVEVKHPTCRTIDGLSSEFGSRAERRRAVDWALDRGHLVESPHPHPQGKRKTFFTLPVGAMPTSAEHYRRAKDGE
jgi:RecA-family ATPase